MPGDVRDYLLAHPDFLADNGDLLAALVPPAAHRAEGVQDFQRYMLARLQEHFAAIKGEHDDLLSLMQEHLQRQNRFNAATLSLLDASSFEATLRFIDRDLTFLLDQESVGLFLEAGGKLHVGSYHGLTVVPEGFVSQWIGQEDVDLSEQSSAAPELFGDKARGIRSQALVRLDVSEDLPPGLLALGHRDSMYYATGLATEQVECLGAVLERRLRAWI